jgi:hypothetical protein
MLESSWQRNTPMAVQLVQSLPFVGSNLKVLDSVSPTVANFFAFLLLVGAFAWAAYKFHDLIIVAGETQRLTRLKLQLELAKLRYETITLSQAASASERAAIAAVELPLFGHAESRHTELPRLDDVERWINPSGWRAQINRLVLSTEKRREKYDRYLLDWSARFEEGESAAIWRFRRHRIYWGFALVFLWFYGPILLLSSIVLLRDPDTASSFAGVEFVVALLVTGVTLRTHVLSRLQKRAYETAHNAYRQGIDARRGGAVSTPTQVASAN